MNEIFIYYLVFTQGREKVVAILREFEQCTLDDNNDTSIQLAQSGLSL